MKHAHFLVTEMKGRERNRVLSHYLLIVGKCLSFTPLSLLTPRLPGARAKTNEHTLFSPLSGLCVKRGLSNLRYQSGRSDRRYISIRTIFSTHPSSGDPCPAALPHGSLKSGKPIVITQIMLFSTGVCLLSPVPRIKC